MVTHEIAVEREGAPGRAALSWLHSSGMARILHQRC